MIVVGVEIFFMVKLVVAGVVASWLVHWTPE